MESTNIVRCRVVKHGVFMHARVHRNMYVIKKCMLINKKWIFHGWKRKLCWSIRFYFFWTTLKIYEKKSSMVHFEAWTMYGKNIELYFLSYFLAIVWDFLVTTSCNHLGIIVVVIYVLAITSTLLVLTLISTISRWHLG